ncbi:MAG: hypothetical protein V1912_09195, partial [bacterium]
MHRDAVTSADQPGGARSRAAVLLTSAVLIVALSCLAWATGCDSGSGEDTGGSPTSSTAGQGSESGDIEGQAGTAVNVGDALVTVRALQATFQPAMPLQRLSEQTPSAPASGESFYQAYVRVENGGATPIRVDPS